MKHNEDTRVKIPLLMHMYRLGYTYISKKYYTIDKNTNIFKEIFKESIERINKKTFSSEEIDKLIGEINNLIEDKTNGRSFYNRLVSTSNPIRLIDFVDIKNNSYNTVSELTFENNNDSFRPDVNILLNGIPISFIEVKKPNNEGGIKKEFDRTVYRAANKNFEKFMNMIQLIGMSNNMEYNDDLDEIVQGSFYTSPNGKNTYPNFFREERFSDLVFENQIIPENIQREIAVDNNYFSILSMPEFKENLKEDKPVNRFATSLFTKQRLMLILRYGILYVDDRKYKNQKHIVRYPQLFAMLNIKDMLDKQIKKGILWHTQGSGKTALACFSSRYIRDYFADRDIKAKFYFIVDRLDLKTQAQAEFIARGMEVNSIESKEQFKDDFKKMTTTSGSSINSTGQMVVVNIHKFSKDSKVIENDYNLSLQRVYYLDEVHRSYKDNGSFLTNLISSDENAIFIGLTGTPIIVEGRRSTDIFGDYIHKYFYDKSIADKYTLKIKREHIETEIKHKFTRILEEAQVKKGSATEDLLYESPLYCSSLAKYIEENFNEFRKLNEDDSLGGMIVSYSSKQARSMYSWFKKNSNLKVALVLHDEGDKEARKQIQDAFKLGEYDLLIVYNMLLTGFDAPRLKKLYLNRRVREHGLLQTLTRVNRNYTNPNNGFKYKFGYVVDFVDIKSEYEQTSKRYLDELKEDLGEEIDDDSIKGMFVDIDEIWNEYSVLCKRFKEELTDINTNLENFQSKFVDEKELGQLKYTNNILTKIKEYHKELVFSKKEGYSVTFINLDRLNKALNLLKDRIEFLKQQDIIKKESDVTLILEKIDKEFLIDFIKTNVEDLNLGNDEKANEELLSFNNLLNDIDFIIGQCADKDDPELIELGEEIRNLLLRIQEAKTKKTLDDIKIGLEKAKKRAENIRDKDKYLFDLYWGDIVSVRVHKMYVKQFKPSKLSMDKNKDLDIPYIFAIRNSKDVLDSIIKNDSNIKTEALEKKFKNKTKDLFKEGISRDQKKFIREKILIESNVKY